MTNFRIKQSQSPLRAVLRVCDAITIAVSLYASQWLAGQPTSQSTAAAIAIAIVIYLLVSEFSAAVSTSTERTPNSELLKTAFNWSFTVLCLSLVAFFTRHGEYFARSSILSWIALTGASLGLVNILLRLATDMFFSAAWSRRRCAVAGLNELGWQLLQNSQANPECGLDVVAFYDDRIKSRHQLGDEVVNLYRGKLEELVAEAKAGRLDTVFVTLPMRAESRIRWLLDELADTTSSVYIVPDFFVFELLHSRWNSIGGLPAVSVFESPLYGVDGLVKRLFDIAAASAALVALLPVFVVCGLLVKRSSPGPVFFRQLRYGLDGKKIWVWKFRTMRTCENGAEVRQATKGDPRITAIGAVLRRTSLDELPQLLNVIEGSMSLVGPRPHASAHNEHYRKLIRGYMLRHKVKPGITGLAQVQGCRGETETLDKMQKRIEFDHKYIQHWSLWMDVKILLRTCLVVFRQENAY
ncbi:MAG: undecaprenyl-phosphate glucose phosphotransferase [Pirellulaceae bacterium]|nr:undecaprenyl-phosphate glucose phosphotransferase [Pirellulaceae bacterium]